MAATGNCLRAPVAAVRARLRGVAQRVAEVEVRHGQLGRRHVAHRLKRVQRARQQLDGRCRVARRRTAALLAAAAAAAATALISCAPTPDQFLSFLVLSFCVLEVCCCDSDFLSCATWHVVHRFAYDTQYFILPALAAGG